MKFLLMLSLPAMLLLSCGEPPPSGEYERYSRNDDLFAQDQKRKREEFEKFKTKQCRIEETEQGPVQKCNTY